VQYHVPYMSSNTRPSTARLAPSSHSSTAPASSAAPTGRPCALQPGPTPIPQVRCSGLRGLPPLPASHAVLPQSGQHWRIRSLPMLPNNVLHMDERGEMCQNTATL
jgi:hypothetical protein